jgi:hypothetical protein
MPEAHHYVLRKRNFSTFLRAVRTAGYEVEAVGLLGLADAERDLAETRVQKAYDKLLREKFGVPFNSAAYDIVSVRRHNSYSVPDKALSLKTIKSAHKREVLKSFELVKTRRVSRFVTDMAVRIHGESLASVRMAEEHARYYNPDNPQDYFLAVNELTAHLEPSIRKLAQKKEN